MKPLRIALGIFISLSAAFSQAEGTSGDWRVTAGLAPNFMQFDAVEDELESDIGFSVWADYFLTEHWFLHAGYDHFEFVGNPTMDSFLVGPGFEFDRFEERWFPYINIGAGVSTTSDFPGDVAGQSAFSLGLRPGIEYAINNNWFVGLSYDYIHVFTSDSSEGDDVALPFISVSYSPDRLTRGPRRERSEEEEPMAARRERQEPRQSRGGAKDSDGDGVRNAIDGCPLTPIGTEVDEVGCPLEDEDDTTDSDLDTVVDLYDQCPNTPRGAKVNGFGCQVQEKIQMKLTVNFAWDSDVIEPKYYQQLNKVARLMKRNPKAKLLIEGHTDSTGSLKYNMGLSHRRAGSIREFLVDSGLIEGRRVRSEGYGPTRPVKTNKTEEGRAANRRILATFYY